jgi:hypothetical protein
MDCVRELRVICYKWKVEALTLGQTKGSQKRGKNKKINAKVLINVHAPGELFALVLPV